MTDLEMKNKIEELLKEFPSGQERYQTSATFNQCIQMMVRGATPYEVIDGLINVADDSQNALRQHLLTGTPTVIVR